MSTSIVCMLENSKTAFLGDSIPDQAPYNSTLHTKKHIREKVDKKKTYTNIWETSTPVHLCTSLHTNVHTAFPECT